MTTTNGCTDFSGIDIQPRVPEGLIDDGCSTIRTNVTSTGSSLAALFSVDSTKCADNSAHTGPTAQVDMAAIAGGVVGGAVGLVAIGVGVALIIKHMKNREFVQMKSRIEATQGL